MICDECETVAHCLKNGCVPKQQPALKPLTKDQITKFYGGDSPLVFQIIREVEAHHGIKEKNT